MHATLRRLFSFVVPNDEPLTAQTASAQKIIGALEQLDPQQARYIACFAYLLGRVARADLQISEQETARMKQIVRQLAVLSGEQASLVVQLARQQAELYGSTENFLVAREFNELATREQKFQLLECLFAVAAADEQVDSAESDEIRRIANELCLSHKEFIAIRSRFRDYLSVLK